MDAENGFLTGSINGPKGPKASLRLAKQQATGLLLVAAALFVVMRVMTEGKGWAGYVEAAAEAAMIGGLADWFAVTAVFRHPLGIPIPHTALIAKRKDIIGASLSEFVQDNFFDTESLAKWVSDRAPAEALGRWLASEENPDLESIPALGRWLESMMDDGHHQPIIDVVVQQADRFLVDNYDSLRETITREVPRYTPKMVDNFISNRLYQGARNLLAEIADDPDHELRRRIDTGLRSYAQRLQTHPSVPPRVEAALTRAWEALETDAHLQERVDEWLVAAVSSLARHARVEVAHIIGTTVAMWDADDASARIEHRFGRDLQFIRFNGTIIGALAGVAIHAVGQAL